MPTLAFVGDVMLGRGVNELVPERPPAWFWGDVLPLLRQTDAVIANLECALTRHPFRWSATPKVFYFRADPAAVRILQVANIRAVALANNHVLDFDVPGLEETLATLDAAGIAHAGAGRQQAEAEAPAFLDVGGVRVGLVAATDNEPPFAATPTSPGTNYLPIRLDERILGRVAAWVERLRAGGAQLAILSLHWGPNMVLVPSPAFQAFGRAALRLGFDVLHGHSAHVLQGIDVRGRRTLLYDTGDALDDYVVDPELRNDWSALFRLDLADDGTPLAWTIVPLRLGYAQVFRARGADFQGIVRRLRALCAPFGTHLEPHPEGLRLPLG